MIVFGNFYILSINKMMINRIYNIEFIHIQGIVKSSIQ